MENRDYVVLIDENGQPYIAHGVFSNIREKGAKYFQKIKTGYGTRYFYDPEEWEAYVRGDKGASAPKSLVGRVKDKLGFDERSRSRQATERAKQTSDAASTAGSGTRGQVAAAIAQDAKVKARQAQEEYDRTALGRAEKFISGVKGAVAEAGGKVRGAASAAASTIKRYGDTALSSIKGAYGTARDTVSGAAGRAGSAISGAANRAIDAVSSRDEKAALDQAQANLSSAQANLTRARMTGNTGQMIRAEREYAAAQEAYDNANAAYNGTLDVRARGAISRAGNAISGAAGRAGSAITGAAGRAGSAISGAYGTARDTVSGAAGRAGSAISGAANRAIDAVSSRDEKAALDQAQANLSTAQAVLEGARMYGTNYQIDDAERQLAAAQEAYDNANAAYNSTLGARARGAASSIGNAVSGAAGRAGSAISGAADRVIDAVTNREERAARQEAQSNYDAALREFERVQGTGSDLEMEAYWNLMNAQNALDRFNN